MRSDESGARDGSTGPVVAIDVTPLVGFRTGVGAAAAQLVAALEHDARITIIPYALSMRARRHRTTLPPGTRIPPIPAQVVLSTWGRLGVPRIDRWIRPSEVVHATNYLAPPSRHPVLVTVHDCAFVRDPELANPETQAYLSALRRAIDEGAHVHTPTHAVAADVEELFGPGLDAEGRLHPIPWGAPTSLAPAHLGGDHDHDADADADAGVGLDVDADVVRTITSGDRFVLAIGRLEPRKDYPTLVRAFALLDQMVPELHLVLAGPDGPDRGRIDDEISQLPPPLRSRVHLVGPVAPATKESLLRQAGALAYASLDEGFGLPTLEAMSAGTPVVASAVAAISEVVGDAGLLVPPSDDTALADALARVLQDEALAASLVERGARRLADFDWGRTAAAFVTLYTELAR